MKDKERKVKIVCMEKSERNKYAQSRKISLQIQYSYLWFFKSFQRWSDVKQSKPLKKLTIFFLRFQMKGTRMSLNFRGFKENLITTQNKTKTKQLQ